jgi:hypothetical protein
MNFRTVGVNGSLPINQIHVIGVKFGALRCALRMSRFNDRNILTFLRAQVLVPFGSKTSLVRQQWCNLMWSNLISLELNNLLLQDLNLSLEIYLLRQLIVQFILNLEYLLLQFKILDLNLFNFKSDLNILIFFFYQVLEHVKHWFFLFVQFCFILQNLLLFMYFFFL